MVWLSRGLLEAPTGFIKLAANGDASDYRLRAMLYEFHYLPVGLAFEEAAAGADVDIRYEAQSYKKDNEAVIKKAGIKALCKPQKSRGGIRHNKFIVLIHKDVPIAVWTGSTNISAGGIFGHSNVGHAIWDRGIAQRYLDYWERLADSDVKTSKLLAADVASEATPKLDSLSPRDDKDSLETLCWYAERVGAGPRIVCATFAFNLDDFFCEKLELADDTLRYAVFDKSPGKKFEDEIFQIGNAVIAPGAILAKGDMVNFLGERPRIQQ